MSIVPEVFATMNRRTTDWAGFFNDLLQTLTFHWSPVSLHQVFSAQSQHHDWKLEINLLFKKDVGNKNTNQTTDKPI